MSSTGFSARIGGRVLAGATDIRQGEGRAILASGMLDEWFQKSMLLTKRHPDRIWLERGVGSHGRRVFRWIVGGQGSLDLKYISQKGGTISRTISLIESETQSPQP